MRYTHIGFVDLKCQSNVSIIHTVIPASAKPLHNHDIVSVHVNNFYCTDMCKEGLSYVHCHDRSSEDEC